MSTVALEFVADPLCPPGDIRDRYERRWPAPFVTAVRYDGTPESEANIHDLLSGYAMPLLRGTAAGREDSGLTPGDWIIRTDDNDFLRYSDATFRLIYAKRVLRWTIPWFATFEYPPTYDGGFGLAAPEPGGAEYAVEVTEIHVDRYGPVKHVAADARLTFQFLQMGAAVMPLAIPHRRFDPPLLLPAHTAWRLMVQGGPECRVTLVGNRIDVVEVGRTGENDGMGSGPGDE